MAADVKEPGLRDAPVRIYAAVNGKVCVPARLEFSTICPVVPGSAESGPNLMILPLYCN